jgi:hypothetical protein
MMMEGGEGSSAPMEGAVVSAGSGSNGPGTAESAGIVVSSGGASLEGAPSLVDEDEALPPAIAAGDGQSGAEDAQQPQQQPTAPPSPVRRVDFGLLAGRSDVPTPAQISVLSQILTLNKKRGVLHDTANFPFLRPLNQQHHRLPPPHFIAWDDFTWRDVINALYIWNRIYSLKQRQYEQSKSNLLRIDNATRYRQYQRNIEELHNNRPAAATDNEDNSSSDNSSSDAAPPRRSVRHADNQRQQQIDVLVAREQQRTSNPTVQERARQQARANSGQQRTRVSVASMVPVQPEVPVDIVGVGSGAADRAGVVQQRQDERQSYSKRKQGENCTTVGGMNDAAAHGMMHRLHKTAAIAVETLHYPNAGQNQPRHDTMTVSFNELDDYNPNGGRSLGAGRRASKPTITVTAESRTSAVNMVKQLAMALEQRLEMTDFMIWRGCTSVVTSKMKILIHLSLKRFKIAMIHTSDRNYQGHHVSTTVWYRFSEICLPTLQQVPTCRRGSVIVPHRMNECIYKCIYYIKYLYFLVKQ